MDQLQPIPLDILLAKLKNPLLTQDTHKNMIDKQNEKMSQVINLNFELLADKYQLLSNALPGCSPELIVEESTKLLNQLEQIIQVYLDRIRKIVKDLKEFSDYDTQVLKGHLQAATKLITQSFLSVEKEQLDENDILFLKENFSSPETQMQNHLLTLIFERNQNLQNVMQKVFQEQLEYSQQFQAQFEIISKSNHFEPLNGLLNNQKHFWSSRVRSQSNLQKKLLNEQNQIQQQSSIMSSIYQPPSANQQLIEAMLKLRDHTHELMIEHYKEICKNKSTKHSKLDGGGTFGYCWTKGYGWRGIAYEYLGLNHDCPQCHILNQDMHSTATKLYDLEYRDKGTWWVISWFLYQR